MTYIEPGVSTIMHSALATLLVAYDLDLDDCGGSDQAMQSISLEDWGTRALESHTTRNLPGGFYNQSIPT